MPGWLDYRAAHYIVLLAVGWALTFPNLGATTLWDVDEGVNAETAREMREADTWVVPTFNWDLRTAKPVLLYWLQRISYDAFGVTEWAARFPSALFSLLTILITYELGRRQFGAATGLLAGIIVASSIECCKLAHAATPDAALIAFITLYLFAFWRGQENGGRSWFLPCGAFSALAVLTKGPLVGLVLPAAIACTFLVWHRELSRVWDRRMISGCLAWAFIAGPWYGLVTAETQGKWIKAFWYDENIGRAAAPMENHSGIPVVYYLICLCLFFAPWSSFLLLTFRHAWQVVAKPSVEIPAIDDPTRSRRWTWAVKFWQRIRPETATIPTTPDEANRRTTRFLLVWIGVCLLACSAAATKLPNYIAPLYPALAILTARFFVQWSRRLVDAPEWLLRASIICVAITGFVVAVGLLIVSGTIPLPVTIKQMRFFPGLENWAWIGLVPLAASALMFWHWRHGNRASMVRWMAIGSVLFVGLAAAFPLRVIDRYKAAKTLVAESGAYQPRRDIRIGSHQYSQPSVVFYVGRRVEPFFEREVAAGFLAMPHPGYLFVPAEVWEQEVQPLVTVPFRIAARHYDYTRNCDIIVVTTE